MPTYQWKGRRWNSDSVTEGTLQADSLASATADLLRQSFEVEHIQLALDEGLEGAQKLLEIRAPEKIRPDVFRAEGAELPSRKPKQARANPPLKVWSYRLQRYFTRQNWSPQDRAVFFRQLSMLLGAGVRLHRAFDVLSQGQPDPTIAKKLLAVPEESCFDEGLRKSGLVSPFEIAQVEAALENGTLTETFLRLAEQAEQWSKCRKMLWLQLSTPLTALTLCWLLFPILGRLVGVLLTSLGDLEKPSWTQSVAGLLGSNWWLLLAWSLPVLVLLLGKHAIERFLSSPAGRLGLLSLPVLGRLCRDLDLAVSLRVFADMVEGGIRLERALDLTQRNSLLDCWTRMRVAVENGRGLSAALNGPHEGVLRQTVTAGEESGKLGYLCGKMQAFYEEAAHTSLRDLLSLVEPAVTVAVAVFVGATCWFCLAPILRIAQSL